jgi:hypothetical protein
MSPAIARRRANTERNLRRLDCLARVSAGRRALDLRRQNATTALDVLVRRAERAASPIRSA